MSHKRSRETASVVPMVTELPSRAVDRGFEPRSGQTKDYEIGICCFFAKHEAARSKIKDYLARNQSNVSEWVTFLTADCCFSELYTSQTKLVGRLQIGHHHQIECNLSSPWLQLYNLYLSDIIIRSSATFHRYGYSCTLCIYRTSSSDRV